MPHYRADVGIDDGRAGAFVFPDLGQDVAGDLGVTPEELRDNLNLLDPALITLRQTTVEREDFTAAFEESLCIMQGISNNAPDPDRCDALFD